MVHPSRLRPLLRVRVGDASCLYAAALVLLLGHACAEQGLERELDRVSRALLEVETAGALRCAPRELATARSQLEFARLESEQGFPARAREHLASAEENVSAARVLSPHARCAAPAPGGAATSTGADAPSAAPVAPPAPAGAAPCDTAPCKAPSPDAGT